MGGNDDDADGDSPLITPRPESDGAAAGESQAMASSNPSRLM